MLSEGFDERIALRSLISYLTDVYDGFNAAHTSVYSIDVQGLQTGGVRDLRLRQARQNTLSSLAIETSGKFYRGSNNITTLLQRVAVDISHFYVIGFYTDDKHDGKFHKVSLRSTRSDVKLSHRDGYFAPKPFNKLSKFEKLVHLEQGFYNDQVLSESPAKIGMQLYPMSDGSVIGAVIFEMPITGTGEPEFELLGYVNGIAGNEIDAFHHFFTFSRNQIGDTFRHIEPVRVGEGQNIIRVVLRDNRDVAEHCTAH